MKRKSLTIAIGVLVVVTTTKPGHSRPMLLLQSKLKRTEPERLGLCGKIVVVYEERKRLFENLDIVSFLLKSFTKGRLHDF